MNVNALWTAAISLGICCAMDAVRASESPAPMRIRVEVTADSTLRESIESCLKAEIERSSGLTLYGSEPALTLSVIVAEQRMSDASMLGYLVYEGGYQPAHPCPDQPGGADAVVVQWQSLRMLPPDLPKACVRIVSDFIAEVVEPTRMSIEAMKNRLKQGNPK